MFNCLMGESPQDNKDMDNGPHGQTETYPAR